jgi:GxxExxY protein
MTENEVAKVIVNTAFDLHTELGPGLLETVYEVLLSHKLREAGLSVERQVPIPIQYHGVTFDEGFRADLVVEGIVIVELKSVETLLRVHGKQLLTQLRLSDRRLGLLINFGAERLKDGIKRVVNGLRNNPESFS